MGNKKGTDTVLTKRYCVLESGKAQQKQNTIKNYTTEVDENCMQMFLHKVK